MADTHPVAMTRDDRYEELAVHYQCVQVMELDEALKDCGVKDEEARRKICKRFLFGMGNFHDQYWFRAEGRKVYPLLCFAETFLNTDTPLADLDTVFAPSLCFAFHESADGAVDWYYEVRDPEGGDPEVGVVGSDD
jgi:hypothetical protein